MLASWLKANHLLKLGHEELPFANDQQKNKQLLPRPQCLVQFCETEMEVEALWLV